MALSFGIFEELLLMPPEGAVIRAAQRLGFPAAVAAYYTKSC